MSKTSQLSQRFRHAIEQGHLRPGDRMPSLRKLCLDHKVSITTAQRAYAELEKQGLIESLPRSGSRLPALSSLSLRHAPPLPDHPGQFPPQPL
ncbi:PLP-dependent aminotransferase family protein, partial [Pseudomonas sp. MWU13-2860]